MTDTKTSAQTLRDAAALMRERAQAVDTSPAGDPDDGLTFTWAEQIRHLVVDPDATHLTTFGHPGVALAVADWLDAEAATVCCSDGCVEGTWGEGACSQAPAVAVARAYLGAS